MAEEWTQDKLDAHIKEIAGQAVRDALPVELLDPAAYAAQLRESAVGEDTIKQVSTAVKAALFVKGEMARSRPTQKAASVQRTIMMIALTAKAVGWRGGDEAAKHYEDKCRSRKQQIDNGIVKALQASSFSGGGALIPEELSAEFIEYLRPATVVRRMGAVPLEVATGRLDVGRQNAGAISYWTGEGQAIAPSGPEFGRLVLNTKKLTTLVPVSNDLIEQVPRGMENIVGNDMIASHAVAEDQAFIRALGTENKPKGLRYLVDQTNNVVASAGTTLDQVTTDLTKAQYRVLDADVHGSLPGWMLNPRSFMHLLTLRNSNGFYVFMDQLSRGELYNAPVGLTTSIPRNLGGGGNESELYYGYFDQLLIGETGPVRLESSDAAGYVQSSTQHNAFQEDETVFRLIHKVDSKLRHNRAFCVVNGITWGSGLDS